MKRYIFGLAGALALNLLVLTVFFNNELKADGFGELPECDCSWMAGDGIGDMTHPGCYLYEGSKQCWYPGDPGFWGYAFVAECRSGELTDFCDCFWTYDNCAGTGGPD